MAVITEDIAKRVQRGARLLDRKVPGWEKQVRASILDIGGITTCVLGQLFGSYHRGRKSVGLVGVTLAHGNARAEAHGFLPKKNRCYVRENCECNNLTKAWRHERRLRLETAP